MDNIEGVRQAYLSKLALVDPDLATHLGYDSKAAEQAVRDARLLGKAGFVDGLDR